MTRRARTRARSWLCAGLVACHGRGGSESNAPHPSLSIVAPALAAPENGGGPPTPALPKRFRLTPMGGIGFDDLFFTSESDSVLAPAGGTGCVELFDARNLERTSVCGIGSGGAYAGGHGEGTTSADFGAGLLFAIDRGSQSVLAIDPKHSDLRANARLSGEPDYVRWVSSQQEVWVTEPGTEQIEIFALESASPPRLARVGAIAVPGGPESLVIDDGKQRAFTHLWAGRTVQIELATRKVGESFPNGCKGSRGIALDPVRGQLFAGCSEGKAVTLDVDHGGKIVSSASTPSGVDIIALNRTLHHLYLPAASDGSLTILGVGALGNFNKLGVLSAAKGTHCAASDDHNRIWACSPEDGTVMVFDDPFAPVTE